jgi:50S ribosomal subunit-associated GTPase HflX
MNEAQNRERRALAELPRPGPRARAILVANKADLLAGAPPARTSPPGLEAAPLVVISAMLRRNIEGLEAELLAPYAELIGPARDGAAVVFDAEIEAALQGALR